MQSMRLAFAKMHGLGNDFVVIDAVRQQLALSPAQIRWLADRHFGVGCDQVLLVEPARSPAADFRYRIFNADGCEVEQCGNGARCFARFVVDHGLTDKRVIAVETRAGRIELSLQEDGQVTVNMGVPVLEPEAIPLRAAERASRYALVLEGRELSFAAVSMGNPHMVLEVEDVARAPVAELGPKLEGHELFPQRVNVGFMQRLGRGAIRLRVFERGVGETLACGSGACAAVVAGRLWGELDEQVTVSLPGGELSIRWRGEGEPVWMTGPAVEVFQGELDLAPDPPARPRWGD